MQSRGDGQRVKECFNHRFDSSVMLDGRGVSPRTSHLVWLKEQHICSRHSTAQHRQRDVDTTHVRHHRLRSDEIFSRSLLRWKIRHEWYWRDSLSVHDRIIMLRGVCKHKRASVDLSIMREQLMMLMLFNGKNRFRVAVISQLKSSWRVEWVLTALVYLAERGKRRRVDI